MDIHNPLPKTKADMNPSLVKTWRSLGEASVNKRALIPMARRGGGRVDSGSMEWWVVVGEDGR